MSEAVSFQERLLGPQTREQQQQGPSAELAWYRLDDGIMGGRSESQIPSSREEQGAATGGLHFHGFINTNGGGFASIRAPLPPEILPLALKNSAVATSTTTNGTATAAAAAATPALRITFRGDGKTYKILLSEGLRWAQQQAKGRDSGAPPRPTSWQADLPTRCNDKDDGTTSDEGNDFKRQTAMIPLSNFYPSFPGGRSGREAARMAREAACHKLDLASIQQIGFMLSLRLSDGSENPPDTFGGTQNIFDFSLHIESVDLVVVTK